MRDLTSVFPFWEKIKDLVDQLIDITLNFRQSGHPGGSRSKVHILLSTMLSGVMRYDLRDPVKKFSDRFILTAGHTIPVVYCALAVLHEALRTKYEQTGDPRYAFKREVIFPEDLLLFRRRGGLPGHAEYSGKTLFLKFNTGPSAHGSPAAVGEAFALKRAGAEEVKVFALEGDAALTPGAVHESLNSAWALKLDNLYFLIDWNNFGIDDHPLSETVFGSPQEWFSSHGWRVDGTMDGHNFLEVARVLQKLVFGENPEKVPGAAWFKTRKGRGYGLYDNKSHGVPHPPNSPAFWETKREFQEKYGVEFEGFGNPPPADPNEFKKQTLVNIQKVIGVLREDQNLVDYIAETLVNLGESVPEEIPSFKLKGGSPFQDPRIFDFTKYPEELYAKPGEKVPNRAALAKFGAWINAIGAKFYGRPLFIVCSADLAESTNIAGFAKSWGDFPGWGKYKPDSNLDGVLLPQEITEFVNSGIMVGMASVNFSDRPEFEFDGFWGACSTYGSFAYLKYGMMRLFSQMAQDCPLKLGKVLWIVGHSGPETADDSRTHFGIFEPGVTQLFPQGQIINLHPWEHNEVPVVLGASLRLDVPIIALHLTRPPIEIPDRQALGIPSHFEAAKGAYVIRNFKKGLPKMGTVIVQGTSTTNNILKLLPALDEKGINVKIVAAISRELFQLQSEDYRNMVLPWEDWLDSMVVTNEALICMRDWISSEVAKEYSLSSDWDNRWRTGGTIEEVLDEAHLTPPWILKAIEKFTDEREIRLKRLK